MSVSNVKRQPSLPQNAVPGPGITVSPVTGLATDYLNHFNEAIMLLDMLAQCPDCIEDLQRWRPASYSEHFAKARLNGGEAAIAAYHDADPAIRHSLDVLTDTMTDMLLKTCTALRSGLPPEQAGKLARTTAANLKPLVSHAGAVINGTTAAEMLLSIAPQAAIDRLMAT